MHGLKGERVLMRIHIGERDRHDGKPLYEEIVQLLRARHYAGATVFRGIMSFGATARLGTHGDRFLERCRATSRSSSNASRRKRTFRRFFPSWTR